MGAWGCGTFDNDTACDWAYALEEESDQSLVAATLSKVLEVGDEYLDSDAATEGLAAAEVVARLRGQWGTRNAYTKTIDQWVQQHPGLPPPELVEQAVAVVDRVLAQPSELLDLWTESGEFASWKAELADLRRRLS